MRPNASLTKFMLVVTVLAMMGVPAMAQAAGQQQQQNGTVDPSASPKLPQASPTDETPQTQEPATTQESLPAAPSATAQTAPQQQQQTQQPDGTAAAQRAQTAGGAASKPAGMAIAPAKQKNPRSLLIKLGAVLAAGAAIGTVYALTRATPATPPNAAGGTTTTAAAVK